MKIINFLTVVAGCFIAVALIAAINQQDCVKNNQNSELRQIYDNALKTGNISSVMWALREDLKQPVDRRVISNELINLCDIKVAGSSTLFCQTNKGITRIKMPQFIGQPAVGSPADILLNGKDLSILKTTNAAIKAIVEENYNTDPKKLKIPLTINAIGEVDAGEYFKEYLKKNGKRITQRKVAAAKLQATQNELVPDKVNQMWSSLALGQCNKYYAGIVAPIFVSQDNYVLDGHHRWAAVVANAFGITDIDKVMMNVFQVNEVIGDATSGLVKMANDFANDFGIVAKAG